MGDVDVEPVPDTQVDKLEGTPVTTGNDYHGREEAIEEEKSSRSQGHERIEKDYVRPPRGDIEETDGRFKPPYERQMTEQIEDYRKAYEKMFFSHTGYQELLLGFSTGCVASGPRLLAASTFPLMRVAPM